MQEKKKVCSHLITRQILTPRKLTYNLTVLPGKDRNVILYHGNRGVTVACWNEIVPLAAPSELSDESLAVIFKILVASWKTQGWLKMKPELTRSIAVQRKTEGDLSKTKDCVSSAPDKHSVQTRTIQDELQPSVTACARQNCDTYLVTEPSLKGSPPISISLHFP